MDRLLGWSGVTPKGLCVSGSQDARLIARRAPRTISGTRWAGDVLPLATMYEYASVAVIAAQPHLMQSLALSAALVADARRAHERRVSIRHGGSIGRGSLTACAPTEAQEKHP